MTVPYWVQDAVFYQIFPDRFANGDQRRDPPNVQPWGAAPTLKGFQGGDLRGILNQWDYLLDLGVTALYLNPIFQATSNHRYNTTDYYRIDPKLGDLLDFKALVDAAHRSGIRIVLDGVFNHCGRGFFAFNDVLENQEHSPYRDWFHIQRFPVDAYSPGDATDYLAWWRLKNLPKFNIGTADVRRYLLGVARYWIEQGADGWRLDVPGEIDDDEFWAEFRQTVKSINQDAYLVGEIWERDPRWVGENHFDGLMNYPLRDAILYYLTETLPSSGFAAAVEELLAAYPRQHVHAMYLPLGSHDTERIWTLLGGEIEKVKLAFLLQFSFPGAPAVYYGDEVGVQGLKDPDCRRAFPWDENLWERPLRAWVKSLAGYRKGSLPLRRGDYERLLVDDRRRCFAFSRRIGTESILVVVNASSTRRLLDIPVAACGWPDGRIVSDRLGQGEYIVAGDRLNLRLAPWSGVWIA